MATRVPEEAGGGTVTTISPLSGAGGSRSRPIESEPSEGLTPAEVQLPEDEEDPDSFVAHKRELRLGMRHRDSFAVHASHLSGAALEEAIAGRPAGGGKGKKKLVHQDSLAVLVRKKHEGQLDRSSQPQLTAAVLGRRVSRDDSVLHDAPTSAEMHAQAHGADAAHELGASAHVGRMADVVRGRSVSAPVAGIAEDDDDDDDDDSDSEVEVEPSDIGLSVPSAAPASGGQASSPSGGGPAGDDAGALQTEPQKKKKSRLRSMAKGVGSFLGLRKSKKKRQREIEAQAAAAGLGRSSSAPEMRQTSDVAKPGLVIPGSPPPRVAGSRAGTPGSGSAAPATFDAVGATSSPVRGILKSPVRKPLSPAGVTGSPAAAGAPKRRISFADQHGQTLANVRYCDDLHYSALANHSAAEYGEGGKCVVM